MSRTYGTGIVGLGMFSAFHAKTIDYREHMRNFEDFVESLEAGSQPRLDGPGSRRVIELILAIYDSALSDGKRVTLPLS